jgi:hypothetical protein
MTLLVSPQNAYYTGGWDTCGDGGIFKDNLAHETRFNGSSRGVA